MQTRRKIDLKMNTQELVVLMAEGNPGAASVLARLLQRDLVAGISLILSLDDMNIRGTQIWLGYKDFAGEDMDKFIQSIENRNSAMLDIINDYSIPAIGEEAVSRGASFAR